MDPEVHNKEEEEELEVVDPYKGNSVIELSVNNRYKVSAIKSCVLEKIGLGKRGNVILY